MYGMLTMDPIHLKKLQCIIEKRRLASKRYYEKNKKKPKKK